jgi:hypothetical protein
MFLNDLREIWYRAASNLVQSSTQFGTEQHAMATGNGKQHFCPVLYIGGC